MFVYIDETGDHNLRVIDSQYPIFGLGALLISEENSVILEKELLSIKNNFFGDSVQDFVLHASELKRPVGKDSDKRNSVMLDPEIRKRFYSEFNKKIIQAIDFKIVVCFILKKNMVDMYTYPADPYYFSYENLLNRIIRYGDNINHLYAEKRGHDLDIQLVSEHERLCKVGIHSYSSEDVLEKTSLNLINKYDNIAGLQVIDLIMSAYARYLLGKKDKMIGNDIDPECIKEKLACAVTVFPYIKD